MAVSWFSTMSTVLLVRSRPTRSREKVPTGCSAAGLEPHLGPTTLIYTSLGLFLTVVAWLVLYRV